MSGIQQGFMSFRGVAGGTGYKYVASNNDYNYTVGGTTLAGATAVPTQPTSVYMQGFIAVIADGDFIATPRAYSTNSGSSWTASASGSTLAVSIPYGNNIVAAYSPTAKRFLSWWITYDNKTGQYYAQISLVTSTGSASSGTAFAYGSAFQYPKTTTWSPALDTFYLTNYGASANNTRYISSAGTGGTTVTMGGNGNNRAGLSNDGYLLNGFFTGSVMELRKYTSADLSAYTNYGTISDPNSAAQMQTPPTWCPVNNKYYLCYVSGTAVYVNTATSSAPQTRTFLSYTLNVTNYAIISVSIFEEGDGTLWMNGLGYFYDPKSGYYTTPYTYKSTDGGATFTSTVNRLGPSKNFSYP
jgi:hypothetical protein